MAVSSPTKSESEQALAEVLASNVLKRSEQLRAILQYVCEAAIQGRDEQLSEYVIGVNVLHRRQDYNPAEDSAVRTRVYELRQKLTEYYKDENAAAPVHIEIPKGGYVPRFVTQDPQTQLSGASEIVPQVDPPLAAPPAPHPEPQRIANYASLVKPWPLLIGALLVTCLLGLVFIRSHRADTIALVLNPLIRADAQPVLICISASEVEEGGVRNRQVGMGTSLAMFGIGNLFGGHHVRYQLRLNSVTGLADFRRYPTVLIGDSSTNQFLTEFTRSSRYRFENSGQEPQIVDSKQPSSSWHLSYDSKGAILQDYGILARLMPDGSHRALLLVGGLQECGTGAAGQLLWRNLPALVQRMPSGWENKNFEALVAIHAIDGVCGAPEIVRVEVW